MSNSKQIIKLLQGGKLLWDARKEAAKAERKVVAKEESKTMEKYVTQISLEDFKKLNKEDNK